ncbi:RHS repeat-associated core domain-containing protein [Catenulispora sp. EB89]|uniref:RHS repeat domain-containing protein n=1 Tax=Catenulispora sp. EB89 TaxID=3156257 RepID=UPI003513C058
MIALATVGATLVSAGHPAAAAAPRLPSVPTMSASQGVRAFAYQAPRLSAHSVEQPYQATTVSWPAASVGVADLTRSQARAVPVTGMPVWVQQAGSSDDSVQNPAQNPAKLTVRMTSHQAAIAAGVTGVAFTVTPDGPVPAASRGALRIGVNYAGFEDAYGGNYGSRLRLVELPGCALTTPQVQACRTATPLAGALNDVSARSVSALMPAGRVSSSPMVVAATSTAAGGDGGGSAGTYSATTLKPSGSWAAGGSTGSFTYDYPISVPPAASKLTPTVGLSYDSGTVDGQTAATQAQASWAGDGWSTGQSFIEQSFAACSDSPEGSAAPQSTSDECYDGPILTLSMNGTSTALVWDSGKKTYKTEKDNGDVVTRITGSDNGSGTHDMDYWKITDRTGTSYYFGLNHLPGWSASDAATDSVDSVPVFSAHAGDPCYDADWANSVCTMAYRWNLDFVTDIHENAMAYYYTQDTNAYGENGDTTSATSYVRDSHLSRIDYGLTATNAYSVNGGHAPDQVVYATADRCLSGTCDPLNSANAKNWPDVPEDLQCTAKATCKVNGPSFYSTVRLVGITTRQWTGSAYAQVDSWRLDQSMPATGDGTSPTLWLSSITHTGADTTAGGSSVTLPSVSFTPIDLQNRVATHDGLPILTRNRIAAITNESGAVIGVGYEQVTACSSPVSITASSNTSSCYPVYWTPFGYPKPMQDWFIKYQVQQVTVADPTGGAPVMSTVYKYLGGGGWHYDDNEVVKAKYRTYGQWRGFGDVQTFTGQGNDAQTEAETTYYRGMSDDNDTNDVTLTDSQGGKHDDLDRLAGKTLETTDYDFAGGSILGSTIDSYWVSAAVATRARTGLPTLTANATGQVEQWTRTAITDGPTTWRKTESDTAYDTGTSDATFGEPLVQFAHGDLADPTQQRCTTTTYAPADTTANLVGLASEVEVDADPCGGTNPAGATVPTATQLNALTAPASVNRPTDVVSDTRTIYDDPALAQTWPQPSTLPTKAVPTKGDVSEVLQANGYTAGAFTYQVNKADTYDTIGRPLDSFDPLGRDTQTSYTTTNGLTTAVKTTNPLGQTTSQTLDPLRGAATASTDPNGITTTTHYDGLGRLIAVWEYGRPTTAPANSLFGYQVSQTAPTVVTRKVMNDQEQYNAATTLYDGLLRVRQTQQPTPQGGRLVTDTFYDSRGWVGKKNTNWWDPTTTPGATLVTVPDSQVDDQDVTAFNGSGQPVLDTSYDRSAIRSQTATAYTGDKTVTVPLNATGQPFAGGAATATVTDALGRTVEKDDYTTLPTVTVTASAITTVAITGGSTQATQYVYNTVGQQTDVKDVTTGEDWSSGYNLLGQTVTKTDPDAGTSTMAYDPAGNVLQTTDSRNKTISFTYDGLNRKTGEFDAPVPGQVPDNQLIGWVYDNANNAVAGMSDPIGKLTTATSYVGANAYVDQQSGFNANGESLGETITIPAAEGALAGSYAFTHTYTSGTALPDHDSYPASPGGGALPAETVTHAYETSLDLPVGPGGLASYSDNADYTPDRQVAELELGLNQGAHADLTNTYDPHTRSLTDAQVTNITVSATPLDDTSYFYDPAGNPTDQTDKRLTAGTVTAETQCFGYDSLDRLTQAWTATDSCAADPTTNDGATIGDGITGSAYWTSWTFDPLGQPTKQVNHGIAGAQDAVTTYTYGTTQPNTLTATTTTGPAGTSATSYGADSAGNTTTRDTSANGDQSLTWSDAGQLTSVATTSGASSYIYGASGTLLLQKDLGRTTLYLPQEELQLDTSTGAITGNRYYALPGGGQAVRSGAGPNYSFEITNSQGTGLLVLDSTLTVPTWRQFTAYGAPRGALSATWPDNKGFLNDPDDTSTGLTNIGARWYDPATGRFLSVDPLFEADSSQEENGYTYSGDNPIAKSDPTGLRPADCYGACETSYLNGLHSNGGYRGMGESGYSAGYPGYYFGGIVNNYRTCVLCFALVAPAPPPPAAKANTGYLEENPVLCGRVGGAYCDLVPVKPMSLLPKFVTSKNLLNFAKRATHDISQWDGYISTVTALIAGGCIVVGPECSAAFGEVSGSAALDGSLADLANQGLNGHFDTTSTASDVAGLLTLGLSRTVPEIAEESERMTVDESIDRYAAKMADFTVNVVVSGSIGIAQSIYSIKNDWYAF